MKYDDPINFSTKSDRESCAIELWEVGLRPLIMKPAAKIPAIRYKRYQYNPPTNEEVEAWPWRSDSNLAILSGFYDRTHISGVPLYHAVFDFEVERHALIDELWRMDCIIVKTRRGWHFHFVTIEPFPNLQITEKGEKDEKHPVVWEVLGTSPHKPVMVPPSIHSDKQTKYCYLDPCRKLSDIMLCKPVEMQQFPEEIQVRIGKDLNRSPRSKVRIASPLIEEDKMRRIAGGVPCLKKLCESVIPKGQRNTTLRFIYARLRQRHSLEYAQSYLQDINQECCRQPLSMKEIKNIIKAKKWNLGCVRWKETLDLYECCEGCRKAKREELRYPRLQKLSKKHHLSCCACKILFTFPDLDPLREECDISQRSVAEEADLSLGTVNTVLRELRRIPEIMDLAQSLSKAA